MTGMIGHHEQAILMAGWAADWSAGPAIRRLAERIINAQQDEIAIMRQWLADRGKPLADHVHMPGMLTAAELEQLEHTHGPDFDRRFLTLMIRHHEGAVAAVDELLAVHGAAQDRTVFKIASDIHVDQTTEIARMKQMLTRFITE